MVAQMKISRCAVDLKLVLRGNLFAREESCVIEGHTSLHNFRIAQRSARNVSVSGHIRPGTQLDQR